MRVFVVARFKGDENKNEIEELCSAVRSAGMDDFCFIRDMEKYEKSFEDVKVLWQHAKAEIEVSDALLIDVTDKPTGGRMIEAGIAYALGLPIFVIVKNGVEYKSLFDGLATQVIAYDEYDDIIEPLRDLTRGR